MNTSSSSSSSSSAPVIAECKDTSEKIDLYESYGLYIKPIARLNLTIQLPPTKHPGQTVSTNEILEKVKKHSLPDEFIYLRVIKSSLEFIRCEGEIENKSSFKSLLAKLDNSTIRMNTYSDVLKIRAAESKLPYPTRHDWDSFFKDSQNPDIELKHGERPDTVYIADVPCKWFSDKKITDSSTNDLPSEQCLKDIFSIFGELRLIEIPLLSNLSSKKTVPVLNNSTNSSETLSIFDAYIQFKDYISFVKAMDTFRGMKLLYIDENKKAFTANIRVDFDRTRYLSDKEIKKREIDKLKAIELEKIKVAQQEKEKEKMTKQKEIANFRMLLEESVGGENLNESNSNEKSKEQRRKEREEARKQKRLAKKQQEEEKKLQTKIALEERKILIAQRKLESMRLLEELFNRVKTIVAQEEMEKKMKEMEKAEKQRQLDEQNEENKKKLKLELEVDNNKFIVNSYKTKFYQKRDIFLLF